MFIDKQTYLSEDQEITVSAPSNVFDFNEYDSVVSQMPQDGMQLVLMPTQRFLGGDSIYITLQTDSDENFGSPLNLCHTDTIAVEWLVPGRDFLISYLPQGLERYFRVYYNVSGTMSSGTMSCALVLDKQSIASGKNFGFLRILLDTEYTPILTTDDEYIII